MGFKFHWNYHINMRTSVPQHKIIMYAVDIACLLLEALKFMVSFSFDETSDHYLVHIRGRHSFYKYFLTYHSSIAYFICNLFFSSARNRIYLKVNRVFDMKRTDMHTQSKCILFNLKTRSNNAD